MKLAPFLLELAKHLVRKAYTRDAYAPLLCRGISWRTQATSILRRQNLLSNGLVLNHAFAMDRTTKLPSFIFNSQLLPHCLSICGLFGAPRTSRIDEPMPRNR